MFKSSAHARPKTLSRACTLGVTLVLAFGTVGAGVSTANAYEGGASSIVTSVVNKDLPFWATYADKTALTDKFQGSIRDMYISPEENAELNSYGIYPDWAKSLEATNAYNEANNTSVVLLVVEYDNEQFNASEAGSKMDIETVVFNDDGTPYSRGLSFDTSDYDYDVSVNTPELADMPSQTKGANFTGLAGRVAPQNDQGFGWVEVNGVKASKLADASPIVEKIEGGLPADTGSHSALRSATTSEFTHTIKRDDYEQTPERQADLKATGLRGIDPANAVDITKRDDTIVRMVPVATGLDRDELAEQENSGNDYQVKPINRALMNPIEVHVVSDRKKERNAHIGEDNARMLTSRTAQAFLKPTTTAPIENSYFGYNFSNLNVDIVPVDPSMVVKKPFAGNLTELSITADESGIQINNRWDSDFTASSTKAVTTKGPVDTDTSREEARLETDRNDLADLQNRKAELTVTLTEAQNAYDEAFANGASDEELERLQASIDNASNEIMELDFIIPDYEQRVVESEKALALAKDRPSDTYTFTYTHIGSNSGAEGPKSWAMNNAELAVGQTWSSSANGIDATFTVVKNEAGELVVDMKLSEVPVKVTELSGNGSVGTGMYIQGNAVSYKVPGYDIFWTELTPEVPTPEIPTPEVPTPEVPTPEVPPVVEEEPPAPVLPPIEVNDPPVPGTSTSIQEEVPGDGTSVSVTRDPLADSAVEGKESNVGIITAISALGALLMGIAGGVFRKVRTRKINAN